MSQEHAKGTQSRKAYASGGVGYKSPGPSSDKAKVVQQKLNKRQAAVYNILNNRRGEAVARLAKSDATQDQIDAACGMTADEIAARLEWHITLVRPRLTELAGKFKIKKTKLRRTSEMGGSATVWRAL